MLKRSPLKRGKQLKRTAIKPGNGNNPTAKQRSDWDKIAAVGCIPCLLDGFPETPATISHAHDHGNKDHDRVYGACPAHHLYQNAVEGIPNRHKNPIEFKQRYGSDSELVDIARREAGI
jgi:hypothetical protein